MRTGTRRPKQPTPWVPQVLELFKLKGHVTSRELAEITGKISGSDAVTRCRQLGIPLQGVGLVNGSRLPRKLYALDAPFLWLALDEALQQMNRYALILNSHNQSTRCRTFRNIAKWIKHVRRMQKVRPSVRPKQQR